MSASYPTSTRRTALIPALIAAAALLIGVTLIGGGGFTVIRFIVSIFALIVAVFAWQAGQWWWLVPLGGIAVLWNPVLPVELGQPELWMALQYIAAAVFIGAGIVIKTVDNDDKRGGSSSGKR